MSDTSGENLDIWIDEAGEVPREIFDQLLKIEQAMKSNKHIIIVRGRRFGKSFLKKYLDDEQRRISDGRSSE